MTNRKRSPWVSKVTAEVAFQDGERGETKEPGDGGVIGRCFRFLRTLSMDANGAMVWRGMKEWSEWSEEKERKRRLEISLEEKRVEVSLPSVRLLGGSEGRRRRK